MGPHGDIWFTEYFKGRVGRITPDGRLSELPAGHRSPRQIVAGGDGNLWYSAYGGVGRLTPRGKATFVADIGVGGPIAPGGREGAIWLGGRNGTLDVINSSLQVSSVALPGRPGEIVGLTPGGDRIWYSANAHGPCLGGGGTCMARTYTKPGTVGSLKPEFLPVRIHDPPRSGGKWARMPLLCTLAKGRGPCAGRLRIEVWGSGRRGKRFRIAEGATHAVALRLARRTLRALRRHSHLSIRATATLSDGRYVRYDSTLRIRKRHRRRAGHRHRPRAVGGAPRAGSRRRARGGGAAGSPRGPWTPGRGSRSRSG